MTDSKLYYLASPYTHEDDNVRKERYETISKVGACLVSQGYHIFGPITESATYQKYGNEIGIDLEGGWDYWEQHDKLMLSKCDGLIVVMLEGWNKSTGVLAEIEFAKKFMLPVFYVNPNHVPGMDYKDKSRLNGCY